MRLTVKVKPIKLLHFNLYWFIVFYINVDMLEDFIKNIFILVFNRQPFSFLNIFLILFGAILTFYLMLNKKLDVKYVVLTLSYVAVYVVSLTLTPEIIEILSTSVKRGILYVLLIVYLMSLVDDYGKLTPYFVPYIYITLVYSLTQLLLRGNPLIQETDYMDFTYNTMLPMLIALAIGICGTKVTDIMNRYIAIIIFAILFIFNLLMGGRASILCVGICVLVLIHFQNGNRKILYVALVLAFSALLYVNYDSLLAYMVIKFPNSRTIWRLSHNILIDTDTSYRSMMWRYIIESFRENPFAVRGFLSDRIYLSKLFSSSDIEGIYGYYAHNLFLEQLFQFGIIAIPFIIAGIVNIVSKFVYVQRKKDYLLTCFFSASVVFCFGQLMVSASYLTAKSFGIVLGIMLYMGKPRKGALYANSANL